VNQVLHEGVETARMGWLLGVTTLFFLTTMVGWIVWVWSPGQKVAMEAAGKLPFDGGEL
jgi:cbb3-type cytochrome oxidase subunit 3